MTEEIKQNVEACKVLIREILLQEEISETDEATIETCLDYIFENEKKVEEI